MTEKWRLKGVDWGRPLMDEQGLPAMLYAPAPKSRVLPCSHLISNDSLKVIAHGNGGLYPFLFPGPVVSLCGDGISGPGGPALMLREGGRLRRVVGLDDSLADNSEVITSNLLLSPFAATAQFTLSDVSVARRVALPISGLPAMVTIHRVTNRGKGVRWISLLEVWSLAPYVVGVEAGAGTGFLGRRLSSVLKRGREGNSYFKEKSVGSPVRVETSFDLVKEVAEKVLPDFGDWNMPQIQFTALTRNVKMHVGKLPVALTTALDPEDLGARHQVLRRVVAESRFEVPAGKSLYGALVTWFGPWDEAKEGLRRLLPAQHFEQNEAVLWRKRVWPGLVARKAEEPAMEAFEGLWYGGCAIGALQSSGARGLVAPPLGFETFVNGVQDSSAHFSAVLEALSWSDPKRVRLALEGTVPGLHKRLRDSEDDHGGLVEQSLWMLVSLANYYGLHGARLSESLQASLPLAMEELALFLQREDLYGNAELLTTRMCDPEADRAHALPQVPSRAEGALESLTATAILVRGCEVFATVFRQTFPGASAAMDVVASRHRAALEALIPQRDAEPWLLRGLFVPDPEATLDHLVALLWMGLPDELAETVWGQVRDGLEHERKASLLWTPRLFAEAVRRDPGVALRHLAERRLLQRGRWPCPDWHSLLDPVGREVHLASARGTLVWPGRSYAISTALQNLAFFGLEVSSRGLVCRSPESLEIARLQLPVLDVRAGARTYTGEWRGEGESTRLLMEFPNSDRTEELLLIKGETWSVAKDSS
jgi:hypothetical protein